MHCRADKEHSVGWLVFYLWQFRSSHVMQQWVLESQMEVEKLKEHQSALLSGKG